LSAIQEAEVSNCLFLVHWIKAAERIIQRNNGRSLLAAQDGLFKVANAVIATSKPKPLTTVNVGAPAPPAPDKDTCNIMVVGTLQDNIAQTNETRL
jgi:hypothetical protein